MNIGRYAPSSQFVVITVSLLISGGLVYGADRITQPPAATATVSVAPTEAQKTDADNWEAALYAIQAANASTSLSAPNPTTVTQMLAAAQSTNVTDTIAKTILINLSSAKSQSLGDDIPTQEQIIATAQNQIKNEAAGTKTYTIRDLTIVPVSNNTLRTYGNAVMQTLSAYPEASEQATLLSIDYAVEGGDKTQGAKLASIGAAYKGAAEDLLAIPVPQTLAPFHLQIINNLFSVSATYTDMQAITTDPLRGLVGLQTYESLMDGGAHMFTSIAQELSKDGILFSKGEPGSAWSALLSPQ